MIKHVSVCISETCLLRFSNYAEGFKRYIYHGKLSYDVP